jgi:hypothetical protein
LRTGNICSFSATLSRCFARRCLLLIRHSSVNSKQLPQYQHPVPDVTQKDQPELMPATQNVKEFQPYMVAAGLLRPFLQVIPADSA